MPYIQDHDAFLLANHGALTVGNTLMKAYFNMETLEFYAKITLMARQLGGEKELSCEELEKLMELRKKFNVPGRHPGCSKCKNLGMENCRCKQNIEPLANKKMEEPGASDFKDVSIEHPISAKTESNAAFIDAVTAKVMAELYK
jgi:L-fuculose-phosphate aldolase